LVARNRVPSRCLQSCVETDDFDAADEDPAAFSAGGRQRFIATIEDPPVVQRILAQVGLPTTVTDARPAGPPPAGGDTLAFDFPGWPPAARCPSIPPRRVIRALRHAGAMPRFTLISETEACYPLPRVLGNRNLVRRRQRAPARTR